MGTLKSFKNIFSDIFRNVYFYFSWLIAVTLWFPSLQIKQLVLYYQENLQTEGIDQYS